MLDGHRSPPDPGRRGVDTAAVTPARSANGAVPVSKRAGTSSDDDASLSGRSVSSRPGSATTAPTCGPGPLVRAGGVEVGPERPHVDRPVRGGVHAVDVHECADGVCESGDGGDVGPGTEDVAGRRDRDHAGALVDQRPVLVDRQFAGVEVGVGPPDRRAGLHPRPDVRVVVEPGQYDLVTRTPGRGEGTRQPVGHRGHVGAEDDAVGVPADKVGDGLTAAGDDVVGAVAGREGAADVADPIPVRVRDGLDHRRGYLGAGGAVEIGVPVGQRRIRRPHGGNVE